MSRLRWKQYENYTEIIVKPIHGLFHGIFSMSFLLILISAVSTSIFKLFECKNCSNTILLGGMAIYLCIFILLIFATLYMIFGYQYVYFDGNMITVCLKIGKIIIGKSKKYLIKDIRFMQAEEYHFGYKGKKVTKYRLVFEYLNQRQDLISYLTHKEAEMLLREPLKKFADNMA